MQNMMWDVKIKMPLIPARGAARASGAHYMSTHILCGGFADFLALTRTQPLALLLDADNSENNGLTVAH